MPGQDFPVVLPRTSEGLYLLQRLRDEAQRYAALAREIGSTPAEALRYVTAALGATD